MTGVSWCEIEMVTSETVTTPSMTVRAVPVSTCSGAGEVRNQRRRTASTTRYMKKARACGAK